MIRGINHLTLSIRHLDESLAFYVEVLGCHLVAKWPQGAYLLAGDLWLALLADEHVRCTALREYTHVAFTVSSADFGALCDRIIAANAPIWQENRSEGPSLYFLDPNGHKLEIHASDLTARIQAAKERPWNGMEFFEPVAETGRVQGSGALLAVLRERAQEPATIPLDEMQRELGLL